MCDSGAGNDEREEVGEESSAEATPATDDPQPVALEIDGCLDLHQFAPREAKELVPAYLEECLALGIHDVRIVHGKGVGVLRTIVHGILEKHPAVVWFGHAADAGSWGATLVHLEPIDGREPDEGDAS